MDDSMIGATQALDFSDQDDVTDDEQDNNRIVAQLNVPCQKGFAGKLFPLHQGDNVIGRGENCDICIPLKGLSREHACIEIQGDSHFIYDKGSRNRTKRNKHYLAASVRYELKDRDALTFGDVDCTYQIGEETNLDIDDSGSETGSESMLPTGLDDETVAQSKLLGDDEGADSDASSDILQPTQPSDNVSQMPSMMRSKRNGDSNLDPNRTAQVTVMETPAASRSKKLMDNLTLPESDEDTTDGEGDTSVPKLGTMVVADSQDVDEEEPEVKSALIGAATQAYVYESDVTTDGEQTPQKKSLLMQPTQAYADSDISTCDEESPEKSPQKRAFLTAATQAYNIDEELDEEISPKKKRSVSPVEATVTYNMEQGVEPTQAYDMMEDEKEKESDRGASILYEPTQAYHATSDNENKKDEEDVDSDSSEEFILEGDTEGEEENEEARQMMVAPTLNCDTQAPMDTDDTDKTQVVEDTQVFDEKAKGDQAETQVFTDTDETQVIEDDVKLPKHGAGDTDETQVFTDDATQVFDDKASPAKPRPSHQDETQVFTDDATQVFDDGKETTPTKKTPAKTTSNRKSRVQDEDATQVFDEDGEPISKGEEQTRVISEEATQVFEDTNKTSKTSHYDDSTQVFAENNNNKGDGKAPEHEEESTQVFDIGTEGTANKKGNKTIGRSEVVEETQTFTDDNEEEEAEFDINAMSTLAAPEPEDDDTEGEVDDTVKPAADEEETQVFETAASTFDIQDIGVAKSTSQIENKKATAVHEDATQVFTEDQTAPVADETVAIENEPQAEPDKKVKPKSVKDIAEEEPTLDLSDAPTQAIEETVKVSETDATVPIQDSDTNDTKNTGKKGRKGRQSTTKQPTKKKEEPKQVIETTDATVPITESETVPITESETVPITKSETVPITEDATMQIVEDTESSKIDDNIEKTKVVKGKAKKKGIDKNKDAGTSAIEDNIVEEITVKTGRGQRNKKKTYKASILDETAEEEDKAAESETVPVSDTMAVEDVVDESVRPKRGGRRGAPQKDLTEEKPSVDTCREDEKDDEKQTSRGRRGRASKVFENTKAIVDTASSGRGTRRKTAGKETVKDDKEDTASVISEKDAEIKDKQPVGGKKGKKSKDGSKIPEPVEVTEPDTQAYGMVERTEEKKQTDETSTKHYGDEAATQRYGEEEETQRYEDEEDSTPDLAELGLEEEEETSPVIPKPPLVPIPSRSPLKSALASPEKKRDKSPSPRRVKFVSQSSESSTENTLNTRPKRGKGKKVEETKPGTKKGKASKKKETDVDTSTAPTRGSRRGRKAEAETTAEETVENEEKTRPSREGKSSSKNPEPVVVEEETVNKVQETRKSGRARGGKKDVESQNEESKVNQETVGDTKGKDEVKNENTDTVISKSDVGRKSVRGKGKTKVEDYSVSVEDKAEEKTVEEPQTSKRGRRGTKNVDDEIKNKVETNNRVNDSSETSRSKRTRARNEDEEEVENKQKDDSDVNDAKVETKDSVATGSRKTRGRNTDSESVSETKISKAAQKTESVESEASDVTSIETSKGKGKGKGKTKTNKESEESTKVKETEKSDSSENILRGTRGRGNNKKQANESSIETCEEDSSKKSSRQSSRGAKKQVVEEAEVKSADKCDITNKTGKAVSAKSKTEDDKDRAKSTRATRGKRKEVEEETESTSTPAKRKKVQATQESVTAPPVASERKSAVSGTPKSTNKRVSVVGTPKNQGIKDLDTSVTHSPTLRQSTVSGGKAKVMFTGVVDEQGTKTVKDLGGELVSSVYDCSHLVTDQIRRTVKFLCCLSRGVPIVTPQWLVSSKGGGVFSDPDPFIVRDDASEKKFKCSLRSSLAKAADKQLLTGYKIHITKSVKPEPASMKDIIQCAGAQYLGSMPKASSSDGTTLIISCPDDKPACEAAIKAGIPVVSAEFVLTGVLRQEVDINAHQLFNSGNGTKRHATGQPTDTAATKKRKR